MSSAIHHEGSSKIQMQRNSNVQVTFSKRRSGLFKKVSELSTLTGANAAVIAVSPGNRVFSLGHPSVEAIADRFLNQNSNSSFRFETDPSVNVDALNKQLTFLKDQISAEKERVKELKMRKKETEKRRYLWQFPVEELKPGEILEVKRQFEFLKSDILQAINQQQEAQPSGSVPVAGGTLLQLAALHK